MSKKLLMAAADAASAAAKEEHILQIPLRNWIDGEGADKSSAAASSESQLIFDVSKSRSDENINIRRSKESIIRKVTVAYGIVELLVRCPNNNVVLDDEAEIGIDNFAVCVYKKRGKSSSQQQQSDDIRGVRMLSSGMSLSIEEPSYLSCLFEEGGEKDDQMGRYLEVELDAADALLGGFKTDCSDSAEGKEVISIHRCHYLLAKILHELFTHNEDFPDDNHHRGDDEPARKIAKTEPFLDREEGVAGVGKSGSASIPSIEQMQQWGVPASICRMMKNLLESAAESGGDAYETVGEVGEDLHLLLFDPDRFLFDHEAQSADNMQLQYRKEKLYGRDKEETLITDTFCRVTRGKSEAFFIGGFSGSGKSMLVDTLRVRVKNVGGYAIKHKFDAMSQVRPLSGVIAAVNQLCLMIKRRLTSKSLTALSKKLKDDFGADIGLLARMLPNVCVLSPEFSSLTGEVEDENTSDKMNVRSVSFTLLRFIRLVSSPKRPIMLFLDDLQWADDTALDVVHTFLSDTMGSCMFFVGTYRDNEVQIGHAIFDLLQKLETSNVPTTKVSLTGLDRGDLNKMMSDSLGLYPRICKSLSDIVFQKTKGNPFFVLEFIQSLQSRDLLQYDSCQKRWLWNEDAIRAEEITDNVLYLLSSKLNQLPNEVRLLLKVMACFGTSTNESVIGYLSESPEYAGVRNGLEGAISDGFVELNAEGYIKFVHDKVREAAYNLTPDKDKKQLHYNLGKTLYSICEGKDVGNTIFLIASQINHGKESIEKDAALRIPVAKLNMKAGKKALDGCDHKMAYFYFLAAISFLPDDGWESYYDLSLRLNLLMARAANSSCQYDEAELTLQRICKRARCLQDKLPAYFLMVTMFLAQGHPNQACATCSSILTQLGETVPETVTTEMVGDMIPETLSMYSEVYGDNWLGKKMEDSTLCNIVKFYSAMATAAYFCKPLHMGAYFVCKMVQLSLRNGVCQYTPLALMQLSSIVIRIDNAAFVHRIAKSALVLSEKFGSSDEMTEVLVNYYIGAGHIDSYQLGAKRLRRGFSSGLSSGNASTAFLCAGQWANFSTISAEIDLPSLLREMDYYLHLLELYKSELIKKFILCYRETVSTLIDRGQTTAIDAKLSYADVSDPGRDPGPGNKLLEMFYFHQVFRNYWIGYSERCHHYATKFFTVSKPGHFRIYVIKFYHGLNSIDKIRKQANYTKMKEVNEIIAAMKVAASHAESNFRNKLELLEAEQYGITGRRDLALHTYDAAIASAQKAKFIHEQGLACEKAGFYCKRMKYNEKSLSYFNQARECYEKWGSTVKVEFIQKELSKLM